MKTAISIPDPIFSRAERFACHRKMSRSALFAAAVSAYLDQHGEENVTEKLTGIYASESSALDPVLTELQSLSSLHMVFFADFTASFSCLFSAVSSRLFQFWHQANDSAVHPPPCLPPRSPLSSLKRPGKTLIRFSGGYRDERTLWT